MTPEPTQGGAAADSRDTSDTPQAQVVTAERVVAAAAAQIFELIADPARQPEWDGNDNLASAEPGQRVRAAGDVFVMTLTGEGPAGAGQDRENHVEEFEEGRLIAWRPSEVGRPAPGHLWRWQLEPVDDTHTRVRHTYDWTRLDDPNRMKRARATTPERLMASIERLAQVAERG